MAMPSKLTEGSVVLAGGSGDLGGRIAIALGRRGIAFRALLRRETSAASRSRLEASGATIVEVDYDDAGVLQRACADATCVVSALNGLAPVMIGMQGNLLDAAIAGGVPRFIPSDYSLDFTKTKSGDNRNMDLRRAFMARIDRMPIRTTSLLNGAFAELLSGEAPIVLLNQRRILHWGDADQLLDFTTKDDVADYLADVALDAESPRILRIVGASVSPRELARIMTDLTGQHFKLFRPGGIGLLSLLIRITRTLAPQSGAVFPTWQGMQYLRDMASGRGKLEPLDNDRYGKRRWTTATDVLAKHIQPAAALGHHEELQNV